MSYQTYFLRTRPEKFDRLIELGEMMGVLKTAYVNTEAGEPTEKDDPDSTRHIYSDIGAWHYIGEISRPTGEFVENEEGELIPTYQVITDTDGAPFIHANFRTEVDLLKLAQQLSEENLDIAEGYAEMATYFVSDENGELVRPSQPHNIFFGE